MLLLKEFNQLTPEERDILSYWRFYYHPKVLIDREIKEYTGHEIEFIRETICKFRKNVRLKFEVYNFEKKLKQLLAEDSNYWDI